MFALRALLPLFYLLHVVSATPTGTIVRRVDGDPASDSVSASASSAAPSSSASSSPDPDAFLQNHFTIHKNCDRTKGVANGARKRGMIEQAVKDTATILHEAQSMQRTDPAFNRYFLPNDVGDEDDDFAFVQRMFTALLNPDKRITIKCPWSSKSLDVQERALALTDTQPTDTPTMSLCPAFFTDTETTPALPDKPYDQPGSGWCEAPYTLGKWVTGAHTLIHEMTHFSMMGTAAGLEGTQEGTTDILGKPDENDGNMDTYAGKHGEKSYAPTASIVLRQHWIDYLAQTNAPNGKAPARLKEPPVGSTENAESYAAAATELFFAKKCALDDYDGTNLLIIEP
ncbi:hypothetical protein C8J57DRAFT_1606001 [Mycena rebaudengoi]|nr:hypothetical protein C8J57DRAFT_1606001 [Mycena rebaudengoi]